MHSVPGMIENGITDFGKLYLNEIGFAPLGVPIAWELSHVVAAACLLFEKYIKWICGITIFILIVGIILVHFKEGWFVVGGSQWV
jgi:putative oxidoreductase